MGIEFGRVVMRQDAVVKGEGYEVCVSMVNGVAASASLTYEDTEKRGLWLDFSDGSIGKILEAISQVTKRDIDLDVHQMD